MAAAVTAETARSRRSRPGGDPASSVTGQILIAAAAPISTPRLPRRSGKHKAATESATGTISSLATAIPPSSGTPSTQYQAPNIDPFLVARAQSTSVTTRSQPIASSTKSLT